MTTPDLQHRFKYHPPLTDEKRIDHEQVRSRIGVLALTFDKMLPDGREKALVMTKLEEAMFWANAAIARDQEVEGTDYVLNGEGERVRIR